MLTNQSNNQVAGSLAGRDNITNNFFANPQSTSPFARLYQDLRNSNSSDPQTSAMSETLLHYTTQTSDIRSLETKLTDSDRVDFIMDAQQLKQLAAKKIMKWETSVVAQEILAQILAMLWSNFSMKVRPAIQAGASREIVDQLVQDSVIVPTYVLLGDNDLNINQMDLHGFLFFLGGNCHIRWDKC
jgi:hypothetical protein